MLTNKKRRVNMPAPMEIKRILVPVNGCSADEKIVKLACNLARESKGIVEVINIIEVERSLPLDTTVEPQAEKGEEILNQAENAASEVDCKVETKLIQAREAGPEIVTAAKKRESDLIVMGVGYKKRLGVFNLGKTIPYVFKESSCQILLFRGAPTENTSKQ